MSDINYTSEDWKRLYEEVKNDMEFMIDKYYNLSTKFHAISKELEAIGAKGHGALFKFRDGTGVFVPVLEHPEKVLSKFEEPPVEFVINFNENTMAEWLRECAKQIKKT